MAFYMRKLDFPLLCKYTLKYLVIIYLTYTRETGIVIVSGNS
jgi:hypothetical protein